jgi:hypothetical protein
LPVLKKKGRESAARKNCAPAERTLGWTSELVECENGCMSQASPKRRDVPPAELEGVEQQLIQLASMADKGDGVPQEAQDLLDSIMRVIEDYASLTEPPR